MHTCDDVITGVIARKALFGLDRSYYSRYDIRSKFKQKLHEGKPNHRKVDYQNFRI